MTFRRWAKGAEDTRAAKTAISAAVESMPVRSFPQPLLMAFLVYLALDLSVASMPGAFVFEPDDSVEGVQMSRIQEAAETLASPAPAPDPRALPARDITARSSSVPARSVRLVLSPMRTGTRSESWEVAPSAEDPH